LYKVDRIARYFLSMLVRGLRSSGTLSMSWTMGSCWPRACSCLLSASSICIGN